MSSCMPKCKPSRQCTVTESRGQSRRDLPVRASKPDKWRPLPDGAVTRRTPPFARATTALGSNEWSLLSSTPLSLALSHSLLSFFLFTSSLFHLSSFLLISIRFLLGVSLPPPRRLFRTAFP